MKKIIDKQKQREFVERELSPLLNKFGSWSKVGNSFGVVRSMVSGWRHGKANPSISTIAKIAIAIEQTTGEESLTIAKRWTVFFGKSPKENLLDKMLQVAVAEMSPSLCPYLHSNNLLPMIKLLAQAESLEEIRAEDIEFLFEMQSKIGYKLNSEAIVIFLKLRDEQT